MANPTPRTEEELQRIERNLIEGFRVHQKKDPKAFRDWYAKVYNSSEKPEPEPNP